MQHRRPPTPATKAGLASLIAIVLAAIVLTPLTSHADATNPTFADQCRTALTLPDRTEAETAWLTTCVSGLDPRTPASPTATAEPTTAPTTAGPTLEPTTPAPTTVAPTTPAPAAWPTAATTGIPDNLTPTMAGPCTIDTPGLYNARHFTCAATAGLRITAAGVTIRNSLIDTGLYWGVLVSGTGQLTIEDTTVGGATGCQRDSSISGGNINALRVKVISGGDGWFVDGNNITIRDSYTKLCAHPPAHADGIQLYSGGANVTVDHSTFDMSATDPNAMTSPIFWSGAAGPAPHITNNLLISGAYSLRIGSQSGLGAVVTGNVIARGTQVAGTGPILVTCNRVATWTGNLLADVSPTYQISNPAALPCT